MVNAILSRAGDAAPMQWDGVTLKAFAGVAAVILSGVVLLAGVRAVVPMMSVVAGVVAIFGATVEHLKLRVETRKEASGGGRCGTLLMRRARPGAWWKCCGRSYRPIPAT